MQVTGPSFGPMPAKTLPKALRCAHNSYCMYLLSTLALQGSTQ